MSESIVPPTSPAARTARSASSADRMARRLLLSALARLRTGQLVVVEEGRRHRAGAAGHDVKATIEVHAPAAWSETLRHGSVGLGRAYMNGWWDTDDLTSALRIMAAALPLLRRVPRPLRRVRGSVQDRLGLASGRDPDVDRRYIHAHYDLSNEFFALFLDETMAYSCAVFESPSASLAEASRAKFDRLCRKLDLGPGDHLVEIGTGWGGLALHAARHYGALVTTTTISDEQFEHARRQVRELGLSDQVRVLNRDYRDLDGAYDKLVSVEMIEAVDWRDHDTFFAHCSRLLKPEGLMALQAIVMADQAYERSKLADDFIKRFIFPGGCIPSVTAISRAVTRSGDMRILDVEDIGRHYAETLARWRSNFRAREEDVSRLGFDLTFRRMWEFYLAYCEAGFLERHISDVQVLLAKPAWRPAGLELRRT
ncbi:MAG TPA: cyclopropane-fatty-acyl-phospholipid synthase family protein [Acidimicrobiales bacterium]|nr:cyclopropane-fatty-acyl-phospholipid synthase family protein [Acidimicrobiales bacterium]